MNAVVAVAEFLPTDSSKFFNEGVFLGFVIFALVCSIILSPVGTRRTWLAVTAACSMLACLVIIVVTIGGNVYEDHENKKNMKSNVLTVYNLDDVKIDHWTVNNVNSGERSKVTILRDGMDADVYLSQDPETYEPTLTPGPSTADLTEWLTKK